MEQYENQLDFVIDTIPLNHDLDPYLKMLKLDGTLCVGGSFYRMNPDFNIIIRKGKVIRGSNINNLSGTKEFLDSCSKNNILADIETITFKQLNDTRKKFIGK